MPPLFDSLLGRAVDRETLLGFGETTLRVVLTVALALVVLRLVRRIKRRWVARAQATANLGHRARMLTLADLLGSVARYAVWTVAAVMVLSDVGVEIGPLLASAGIAGLAIGFGAQTLVKDVISGFFLLFDNTVGSGDLITFNGREGTVEYVGLRLIKVRAFDGELIMIPAGEMRVFGNKSLGYARAIVTVGLSYGQDAAEALGVLGDVAAEWAATDAARAALLDEAPEVQGVMAFRESGVEARIVAKVRPGEQFEAERTLRRLVKEAFDARGIEIPAPQRTITVRAEPGAPVLPAAPASPAAPPA